MSDRAEPSPSLLDVVEAWCGEPLSVDVGRRLGSMPPAQLQDFTGAYFEGAGQVALPQLPGGHLRPVWHNELIAWEHELNLPTVLPLSTLAYAHEMAMPSQLGYLGAAVLQYPTNELARAAFREALTALGYLAPLVRLGILHILPEGRVGQTDDGPAMHLLYNVVMSDLLEDDALRQMLGSRWNGDVQVLDDLRDDLIRDLRGSMQTLREWNHGVHPLFELPIQRRLYVAARRARGAVDLTAPRGFKDLELLHRCGAAITPHMSVDSIVELRRNADAFDEWRRDLRLALLTVADLPDNETWPELARAALDEALRPAASKIESELKKSRALQHVRTGARSFAIGLFSALGVELMAGGGILPKVAAAGLTAAANSVVEISTSSASRKTKRAQLDHYVMFAEASHPAL